MNIYIIKYISFKTKHRKKNETLIYEKKKVVDKLKVITALQIIEAMNEFFNSMHSRFT